MTTVRVAAVQASPVFLQRDASVEKAIGLISEAAAEGAKLIVLPEAFIPAWPAWVDVVPPGEDDEWHGPLLDQAVVVGDAATEALAEATRSAAAHVVVGVNERDATGTTLYNTILYFGPDGLLGKHRKLMPTHAERLVWGLGDGSDLGTYETPFGRIGGLICWENYMPLARFAVYAHGVDIWVAPTLACSEPWVATLRHIAREGRCVVIGCAPAMRHDALAPDTPGREKLAYEIDEYEGWLLDGYSAIVDHTGTVLAGPLVRDEGILYADVDVGAARLSRRFFDPVGHYNRPDVFDLRVDDRPKPGIRFSSQTTDGSRGPEASVDPGP